MFLAKCELCQQSKTDFRQTVQKMHLEPEEIPPFSPPRPPPFHVPTIGMVEEHEWNSSGNMPRQVRPQEMQHHGDHGAYGYANHHASYPPPGFHHHHGGPPHWNHRHHHHHPPPPSSAPPPPFHPPSTPLGGSGSSVQACIENFSRTGRMTFIADHHSTSGARGRGNYSHDSAYAYAHNYDHDGSYHQYRHGSSPYYPRDREPVPGLDYYPRGHTPGNSYRQPRMASANPAYHHHHHHHHHNQQQQQQQQQQREGGEGGGGGGGGTWRSFQQRRHLEVNTEQTPSSRGGEPDSALPPQTWSAGGWVYGGVEPPPDDMAAQLPSRHGVGEGGPPTWGSELSEISYNQGLHHQGGTYQAQNMPNPALSPTRQEGGGGQEVKSGGISPADQGKDEECASAVDCGHVRETLLRQPSFSRKSEEELRARWNRRLSLSSDGSQRRRSINSIDADLSSADASKPNINGRTGLDAGGGGDESMVVAEKVGSFERGSSSGSLSRLTEDQLHQRWEKRRLRTSSSSGSSRSSSRRQSASPSRGDDMPMLSRHTLSAIAGSCDDETNPVFEQFMSSLEQLSVEKESNDRGKDEGGEGGIVLDEEAVLGSGPAGKMDPSEWEECVGFVKDAGASRDEGMFRLWYEDAPGDSSVGETRVELARSGLDALVGSVERGREGAGGRIVAREGMEGGEGAVGWLVGNVVEEGEGRIVNVTGVHYGIGGGLFGVERGTLSQVLLESREGAGSEVVGWLVMGVGLSGGDWVLGEANTIARMSKGWVEAGLCIVADVRPAVEHAGVPHMAAYSLGPESFERIKLTVTEETS